MLRIAHCLDNRVVDGDKVVSPMHLPRFNAHKRWFSASGSYFCYQGLVRPKELDKLEKCIHLTGSRTRDHLGCRIVS
jgi:hypothetical protein